MIIIINYNNNNNTSSLSTTKVEIHVTQTIVTLIKQIDGLISHLIDYNQINILYF